jgi:hypothetical protein
MKHCLDRENGCNPYGDACSCGCNICLNIKASKIPEVSHREIYMKTCDMMYTHYAILNIVDIETALGIIRGVLENNNK